MSQGIMTFPSLEAAARYGFEQYDRTETGYLVRKRIGSLWAMAIVDPSTSRNS